MPEIVPDDVFGLFAPAPYPNAYGVALTLFIDGLWAGSMADAVCIMTAYGGVGAIEYHLNDWHVLFSSVNHRGFNGVPLEISLAYGDALMTLMFPEERPPTEQYDGGCNTYLALELDPLQDVTDRFFTAS